MPGFKPPINQERPIRILNTLLKNRTLPHAFLFTGPEGVGKKAVALALAMAFNCQRKLYGLKTEDREQKDTAVLSAKSDFATLDSCGVCKTCRKIESRHHADIIQIQPSGAFIKIAQIRELVGTLAMKPYEATIRVVVISNAQAMNAAASNALLKILEEPPDRTMLVLIATQRSDLLPTIVSRCQHIGFNPITKNNLAALLSEKHGFKPETAETIAAMANGSFYRAQALVSQNWLNRREWLLDEIEALSLQQMSRLLALAQKLSAQKEIFSETLAVMKVWFRDLIIAHYDPDKIINQDIADKVKMASEKATTASLLSKFDAVQHTQNGITANSNLRLTTEHLLMQLAQP